MKAEIISIGTELLVGSILNTNVRFLSQKLAENAIDLYHQVTVGDNPDRIIECLEQAVKRSDLVIASGGLGPTEDDVTVKSVARFLKTPLVFHKNIHKAIVRRLKLKNRRMLPLIKRQCYAPQGAFVLENKNGTASGILAETFWRGQKKWILLLPGPPRELEPLFLEKALPLFLRRSKLKKEHFVVRSVRISGLLEAEAAVKMNDLLKSKPPLTVGIYAKPGEVELKIMVKSASHAKALASAQKTENTIRRRFGEKVYGVDGETLSSALGDLLLRRKKTLSVAESCTGGFLSTLITDIPGSSDYFLGGVVAYSDEVKTSKLGVSAKMLKKYGAVSAPVAFFMAKNCRIRFSSDYGVGITGIAGPSGGSGKKPVGLVYIAISGAAGTRVFKNQFFGNRTEIKNRAAQTALDLLRLHLMKKVKLS